MSVEAQKGAVFELARDIWRRRKWLVILFFGASFLSMGSLAVSLPNFYRASATVLVEGLQVPETFVRSAVTSELETRLHTISQKTLSRMRLEDLITRFDLYPDLRRRVSLETVIKQMRRDIHLDLEGVELSGGRRATIAFTVSYLGRNPQTVADVTNALASFYVEENLKIRGRQATETADFLRSQLQEVKRQLEEQERQLGGIMTVGKDQPSGRSRGSPSGQARSNGIGRLDGRYAAEEQVSKLKKELIELRSHFSDKYPDVIRVKTEIAALERQLAETKRDRMLKKEQTAGADARSAPVYEEASPQLMRDYETTKELYSSLLKRYADAQLSEKMEEQQKGEEFRILDPALAPELPAAPSRIRLVFFGLVLSLGMAAGAVVLAERLDTSFHTAEDLRTFTRLPVLVRIPRIVTAMDARLRRRRTGLAAVAAVLGLTLIVGATYSIAHENEQLVRILARASFYKGASTN